MITNQALLLLMLSMLRPSTALPFTPENIGNLFGMAESDGRILQRSKRGWMWNQFFLLEEYAGNDHQYVGKLHSNMDKGDGSVKYVLTGEGAGTLFLIDEKSGDIHATKRLDREEKAMYTLIAKVLDRNTNAELEPDTEFNIKIHDINDNAPKFAREIYFASRKKEPLIISKEDVRDNVVSYNDEGGGEEDTQAFDIGTLRNPEVMDANKLRRDIIPEMLFPFRRTSPMKDNTDVRDFINGRLQENDSDPTAPPYDSLATYAYEGTGSLAESLSSLESAATEGDQDYDYLSNWGPQFKKLAEMYIPAS
uniref:Cadherin-6 n=1 Tax=Mastacembelus armatus TaxID=205130 RepID=A0A7N8WN30_9TELE